jgi:hypothetical protein
VIASEIRPQKNAKRNIHFWCDPWSNFRAKYECKKPLQTGKELRTIGSPAESSSSRRFQIVRHSTPGCEEGKMHDRTGNVGKGSYSNKTRSVVEVIICIHKLFKGAILSLHWDLQPSSLVAVLFLSELMTS